jgi:hypothetical protein
MPTWSKRRIRDMDWQRNTSPVSSPAFLVLDSHAIPERHGVPERRLGRVVSLGSLADRQLISTGTSVTQVVATAPVPPVRALRRWLWRITQVPLRRSTERRPEQRGRLGGSLYPVEAARMSRRHMFSVRQPPG